MTTKTRKTSKQLERLPKFERLDGYRVKSTRIMQTVILGYYKGGCLGANTKIFKTVLKHASGVCESDAPTYQIVFQMNSITDQLQKAYDDKADLNQTSQFKKYFGKYFKNLDELTLTYFANIAILLERKVIQNDEMNGWQFMKGTPKDLLSLLAALR